MDTQNLSFRRIYWAQKLSGYHFQIDYQQSKVNTAVDALLWIPQRSQDEKNELQAENGQIFYCLQNSLINARLAGLSLSSLSLSSLLLHLYQVFIYRTYILF